MVAAGVRRRRKAIRSRTWRLAGTLTCLHFPGWRPPAHRPVDRNRLAEGTNARRTSGGSGATHATSNDGAGHQNVDWGCGCDCHSAASGTRGWGGRRGRTRIPVAPRRGPRRRSVPCIAPRARGGSRRHRRRRGGGHSAPADDPDRSGRRFGGERRRVARGIRHQRRHAQPDDGIRGVAGFRRTGRARPADRVERPFGAAQRRDCCDIGVRNRDAGRHRMAQ